MMLSMSVVASAVPFAAVCLGGRLREADANRVHTLVGEASDIMRGWSWQQ